MVSPRMRCPKKVHRHDVKCRIPKGIRANKVLNPLFRVGAINSTAGSVLALHVANSNSIPGSTNGP